MADELTPAPYIRSPHQCTVSQYAYRQKNKGRAHNGAHAHDTCHPHMPSQYAPFGSPQKKALTKVPVVGELGDVGEHQCCQPQGDVGLRLARDIHLGSGVVLPCSLQILRGGGGGAPRCRCNHSRGGGP